MGELPWKFRWQIPKFSKMTKKTVRSETFIVKEHEWRLIISPNGQHLKIYLQAENAARWPAGEKIKAKFTFAVVNQSNNKELKVHEHEFGATKAYFSYPTFISLSELRDPDNMYLVNDALTVEVVFKVADVLKDPFYKDEEDFEKVQTETKNLLREISQILSSSPSPSSSTKSISEASTEQETLQKQNEALEGFFNMSLETIKEADSFDNVKGIVLKLTQNAKDLKKKKIMEILLSELKKFEATVSETKPSLVESTQDNSKSLTAERRKLDSTLSERQKEISFWLSEYEKVSNELKKAERKKSGFSSEDKRLGFEAYKEQLLTRKKSFIGREREAYEAALEVWKEWEKLKKANEKKAEARKKLAMANANWKRFKEDLGFGRKGLFRIKDTCQDTSVYGTVYKPPK